MKVPHLIALAAGIALLHLLVIFLVMNGGCSDSSADKAVKKPAIAVSPEKNSSLPAPSGKFKEDKHATTVPITPAAERKKDPGKPIPTGIPRSFPSIEELPSLPGETDKVEKFGNLPPPSRHRNILNRAPYDYRYAVKGRISAVPGLAKASTGILLEVNTRRILWMKNPHKAVPIASMSKIMTMLLACEDVENGRVSLSARIPPTKKAMAIREGVVWMHYKETFTLQSLLEAAAVRSANDASMLISEYLGNGKSETFIARMNRTAKALGMKNTQFFNPHGLPGRTKALDNRSSPEDMLKLCEYAMTSPLFRELVRLQKAQFRKKGERGHIMMWNHNHLLPGMKFGVKGVRGIKTGFTRRAGFCVAVSCIHAGKEYLAVVTGFSTAAERDRNMRALLQWGFIRSKDPTVPENRIVLKSQTRQKKAVRRSVKKRKVHKTN